MLLNIALIAGGFVVLVFGADWLVKGASRLALSLGMLGIASLGMSISEARAKQRYDEMLLLVAFGAGIVLLADLASMLARRWVRRAT